MAEEQQYKPGTIARNDAGDRLIFTGSEWVPVQVASNDAGQKLINMGEGWIDPSQAFQPPPAEPGASDNQVMRQLGLGTRSVLEGVVNPLSELVNAPLNLGIRGFNAASQYLGGKGDVGEFQPAGTLAANALGLPQAETEGEKTVSAAVRGGAGALPFIGTGQALATAAPKLSSFLTAAPRAQMTGGVTAGAAAEEASQRAETPTAKAIAPFVAGIAGGMAPALAGGLVSGGARAVSNLTAPYRRGGQERLVSEYLQNRIGKEDLIGLRADLNSSIANKELELVPGSKPTLSQATGSGNLGVVERAIQSSPGGEKLTERYLANQEARQEAIGKALKSDIGQQIDSNVSGGQIRGAFDDAYQAARQEVRDAYQAIDPDGTARFDSGQVLNSLKKEMERTKFSDMNTPSEAKEIMRRIELSAEKGENFTYQDLQDIRSIFSDAAREAGRGTKKEKFATALKHRIDDFFDGAASAPGPEAGRAAAIARAEKTYAADLEGLSPMAREKVLSQLVDQIEAEGGKQYAKGFTPEQAEAFKNAKALRAELGRNFQSGVNLPMTQKGNTFEGNRIATHAVPENYLKSGGAGEGSVAQLAETVPEALPALRQYTASKLTAAPFTGEMPTTNRTLRNLQTYGPALNRLGDKKILDAVRKDVIREERSRKKSGVPGSQTSQMLQAQADIANILNPSGVTGGNNILTRGLSFAGNKLTEGGRQRMAGLLQEAFLDPEKALRLLQMQQPDAWWKVIAPRYGKAALTSGGRQSLLDYLDTLH